MKFIVVLKQVSANIFGHEYELKPIDNSPACFKNILVMDDNSASELLKKHKNILAIASFETDKIPGFPLPLKNIEDVPHGSRILIIRAGGIGDHIMLTPAIKAFQKSKLYNRDIELWLSIQKDMFPIFSNNPFVNRLLALPLTMDKLLEADYVIDFSDTLNNSDFNRYHPVDYYLKFLGMNIEKIRDKKPFIYLNSDEESRISKKMNKLKTYYNGKPLILIQWEASAQIRRFPPQNLAELTRTFPKVTFVVAHHYLNNEKTDQIIQKENMNIINLSGAMKSLYDYLDAVASADIIISTDSSAYHIAAAFGKPSIALFGSIKSDLRTHYYSNIIPIDANYKGKICSSPCGRHKGECPEAIELKTFYSPCLMSIAKENIEKQLQKIINKFTNI